ncbi:MAG: radical SAM protein [Candidatus Hydrothermarchaeota archaeon]
MSICKNKKRRYYRFRADRFYGGIATADCMGCNLDCAFCWSYYTKENPMMGNFYSSKDVALRLIKIAKNNGFRYVRISGNEPTLCRDHLLNVIKTVERKTNLTFILETNGIELGKNEDYIEDLKEFKNLHVRVSFKVGNPNHFEIITNRPKSWFNYQLKAIEYLYKHKVSFHPAIVKEYHDEYLIKRLVDVDSNIARNLEFESLKITAPIKRRLLRRGLLKNGSIPLNLEDF